MISGNADIIIRKPIQDDLDLLKVLADAHRRELGFVRRPTLQEAIYQDAIWVAQNNQGIVGFVEYHHRKDHQTTLYHIVVQPGHRRQGIGRQLIEALKNEAHTQGKTLIQLKCPVGLPANEFYERLGFHQIDVLPGKKRALVVWQIEVA